ncbi:RhuM family protein [Devosia sp.]|uniref:RhuM family protein n=1 Tax=Devosia sp. TaxID=1871048 RepID=UPI001ACB3EB1|nr:RhuM family protein [Devosia sp.]MBN9335597.1 virulence RhuM family protein [Devosia sp.]
MAQESDKLNASLTSFLQKASATEPVHITEEAGTGHRFIIYGTDKGTEVQLQFHGEALWMTQSQIADLFGRDVSVVSRHIANILEDGELEEESNLQKVQIAGSAKPVTLYSLDMVISVGYRVSSRQATMFRKWATETLVQFATKGFVVDVERLKAPADRDHFRELRELIREIRASEANVYRELRQIIALCNDYEALSEATKNAFFAATQNKLLYAVTSMTAPEIRLDRAKASSANMGLTSWKKRSPNKKDIYTAKNYLADAEIKDLNRFTNMLLDYFEQETELQRLVTTADAERAVERFVKNNERPLLKGGGSVSKLDADRHCEAEYDKFDDMRKLNYLRDVDEGE